MDLAELENELSRNLEDRRFWAVYADALDLAQQPARATAIRRALAEYPSVPDPELEPARLGADWRFGHWRALWTQDKGASLALAEALGHGCSRFLEHLVLGPEVSLHPLRTSPPPLLTRLDLLGRNWLELSQLGPVYDQLQILCAPAHSVRRLRPSPSLVHLVLDGFLGLPPAPLPRLEVLELAHLPPKEQLTPALFPALHTLRLLETLRPERLEALLSSPIGRQLRRLELSGTAGQLAYLETSPQRWEGLELTLNLEGDERPSVQRGRLRVRVQDQIRAYADEEEARYLRLAPPASALQLYRGLLEVCDALDLRVELEPEPWLAVPRRLAAPLARFLASRCGAAAQVLEVIRHVQGSRADLEVRATEFSPDGFEYPADLDLTRTELSYDDEVEGTDTELSEESLYQLAGEMTAELFSHTTVGEPRFWVPASFRPDPWTLGRPASAPRRLARAGSALALEGETGPYLAFRARAAGVLQRCPLPDLSRWTERLLRRHQLEDEPEDPSHPFWADWEQRTRPERLARSSEGTIPHYKLLARGRWLLAPEEVALLRSALRTSIEHHRPPAALEAPFREAVQWLEAAGELEVEVAGSST